MLEVKECKVWPVSNGKNILANVQFNISGLIIKNCTIVKGRESNFLSFPSMRYTTKDGDVKYKDIVYPVTADLYKHLQEIAFENFKTAKSQPPADGNRKDVVQDEELPF